jgi:signal peptidase II
LRPHLALGFVCGGALGNLIDRLAIGAVRDFIDLHWMDKANWPTFNLADAAICIGVGLLLLEALLTGGKGKPGEEHREA